MTEIKQFLTNVELFLGLSDEMLDQVATLCQPKTYQANSAIFEKGSAPEELFLVKTGSVRIETSSIDPETNQPITVTLGRGQTFGEMSLVDQGQRSASVRADIETDLLVINCAQLEHICEKNTDLGYRIMRNIATDLSFKLRNRNLI